MMWNNVIFDSGIPLNIALRSRKNEYNNSKAILKNVEIASYNGLLPAPILTEIYYKVSGKKGEQSGKQFVRYVLSIPNTYVMTIQKEHSLFAGKIYFKYNYEYDDTAQRWERKDFSDCLSVVDCLILAIGNYAKSAVVCTYDKKMLSVTEIDVKKPEDIII